MKRQLLTLISRTWTNSRATLSRNHTDWRCSRSTGTDQALVGFDTVVLLAAEHRDDVSPTSLYYDVNVQGTRNVLAAMEKMALKISSLPVPLLFMV